MSFKTFLFLLAITFGTGTQKGLILRSYSRYRQIWTYLVGAEGVDSFDSKFVYNTVETTGITLHIVCTS